MKVNLWAIVAKLAVMLVVVTLSPGCMSYGSHSFEADENGYTESGSKRYLDLISLPRTEPVRYRARRPPVPEYQPYGYDQYGHPSPTPGRVVRRTITTTVTKRCANDACEVCHPDSDE